MVTADDDCLVIKAELERDEVMWVTRKFAGCVLMDDEKVEEVVKGLG